MRHTLTRRSFLQGATALGAVAALGACLPKVEARADEASQGDVLDIDSLECKYSWCHMCGSGRVYCATKNYVKDGKFVFVEGNPEAGNNWGYGCKSLCAKGNSAMQTVYDPTRIQYPMKRVGERGENKFERCTWDEALEAVAAKLLENREVNGPWTYAALSPQGGSVVGTLGRRFLNVYGSPNYLHSAICQEQITSSRYITIGQSANSYPGQLNKTKLLISWGVNGENADVNNVADRCNPVLRFDAMDHGLEFIDIRPMLDPLAAHASEWVPVRPGTDLALALAFLNVIIEEDLYDHEFCENWCNGFEEFAEHIKQFPPSWAAPITGISEEQIVRVARRMGTEKPMGIMYGNGAGDQANDGNWLCCCINIIEAITGNLDVPGGGGAGLKLPEALVSIGKIDTLKDRLPVYDEDTENGWAASRSKLTSPEFPRWYQNPGFEEYDLWKKEPSSAYNRALQAVINDEPLAPKIVFAHNANPMSGTRQPKLIAEALKKLDLFYVMDTYWTESCKYADYVFPATIRYEHSCLINTRNMEEGTFIGIEQQVVEPLGECRSDWQFYCDLAVKMGWEADFWDGDFDNCLREQLADTGITLEELREKGYMFFPREDGATSTEPEYQRYEELFAGLPNGKVQLYNELIGGKPNNREDGELGYLPVYQGPPEGLAETPELAEEYPLIFSDVHSHRLSVHSYFSSLPYLRERGRKPWAKINPATAQKYGIEDGDWMKVESPHGWVKLVAEYFEGISPEVIMSKRGFWQECPELGEEGYGCMDGGSEVNVLYDSTVTNYDPFHAGMAKQTLVKISKWEG